MMNHHPEERMGRVFDVWPAPGDELDVVISSYGMRISLITIRANGPFWVRLRAHNNQFPGTWITCTGIIVLNNTVYLQCYFG